MARAITAGAVSATRRAGAEMAGISIPRVAMEAFGRATWSTAV